MSEDRRDFDRTLYRDRLVIGVMLLVLAVASVLLEDPASLAIALLLAVAGALSLWVARIGARLSCHPDLLASPRWRVSPKIVALAVAAAFLAGDVLHRYPVDVDCPGYVPAEDCLRLVGTYTADVPFPYVTEETRRARAQAESLGIQLIPKP